MHHTPEYQEVSPFPAGDHRAARKRQNSMTNIKHKKQNPSTKEQRLQTVSQLFHWIA